MVICYFYHCVRRHKARVEARCSPYRSRATNDVRGRRRARQFRQQLLADVRIAPLQRGVHLISTSCNAIMPKRIGDVSAADSADNRAISRTDVSGEASVFLTSTSPSRGALHSCIAAVQSRRGMKTPRPDGRTEMTNRVIGDSSKGICPAASMSRYAGTPLPGPAPPSAQHDTGSPLQGLSEMTAVFDNIQQEYSVSFDSDYTDWETRSNLSV